MAENPTIPLIKTREGAITKLTGDGLTGPNWVTWRVRMWSLLALCEVEAYVHGEIPQPARDVDPVGHDNWKKNDNYAKHLITQNVADEPLVHIQHGSSSHSLAQPRSNLRGQKPGNCRCCYLKPLAYYCRRGGRH